MPVLMQLATLYADCFLFALCLFSRFGQLSFFKSQWFHRALPYDVVQTEHVLVNCISFLSLRVVFLRNSVIHCHFNLLEQHPLWSPEEVDNTGYCWEKGHFWGGVLSPWGKFLHEDFTWGRAFSLGSTVFFVFFVFLGKHISQGRTASLGISL